MADQKDQELAWYRRRVARLEEQLRGIVDPELDQKQIHQVLNDQSQFDQADDQEQHQLEENKESKSATAETPQPKNNKKRKKRSKKPKD